MKTHLYLPLFRTALPILLTTTTGLSILALPQTPPVIRQDSFAGSSRHHGGEGRGSVVRLIARPEVQSELNLSPDQQKTIGEILQQTAILDSNHFADFNRVTQSYHQGRRDHLKQNQERIQKLSTEVESVSAEILALLTTEQATRLEAIQQGDRRNTVTRQNGAGGGGFSPSATGGSGGGFSSMGNSGGGGGANGNIMPGNHSTQPVMTVYQSRGGPGSVLFAIARPDVQGRLRLTPKQLQKIQELLSQYDLKEREAFTTPMEGISREQRRMQSELQFKQQSMNTSLAQSGKQIEAALDRAQARRLEELCLQAEGADALLKPELIRALGITTIQQAKLANLKQQGEQRMSSTLKSLHEGNPSNAVDPAPALRAIQAETEAKMLQSVLTPDQLAKLARLRGKEFPAVHKENDPVQSYSGSSSDYRQNTR